MIVTRYFMKKNKQTTHYMQRSLYFSVPYYPLTILSLCKSLNHKQYCPHFYTKNTLAPYHVNEYEI